MAPSMPTSRAATPGAPARCPSDTAPRSLSVTHRMQRSSSDMILDSDNEVTPPPRLGKGAGEDPIRGNDGPPPEQQPPAQITSEPQTGILEVEPHENQAMETLMPPVQDLSLASPETKPNPFTASKIFLHSPGALSPLVRSITIPDVGHLSLHSPAVHDAHSRDSTVASQWSPTQKTYIFSAADIRTLVAARGSDEGSGPNNLAFSLDWDLMNGITKWRNFKAGQG